MSEKEAIEMLYTLLEKNVLPNHYDGSYEEAFDIIINLLEQKDNKINKLKNKMIGDKMEQFDDYVIYLIESYLEIMGE